MKRPDRLWRELQHAGLVEGAQPADDAVETPWFVRVMLGVAGWLGALFLVGFVAVGFDFVVTKAAASLIVGAGVCFGAAMLLRSAGRNPFVVQFGFAVSLAGQGLILIGLDRIFREPAGIGLAMAVVQAALFFLVPNFIHRVWAAGTAALALALALGDWRLYAYAPPLVTAGLAWIWLNEFERAQSAKQWRAGGYGLAFAVLVVLLSGGAVIDQMFRNGVAAPRGWHEWVGAGLSGAVFIAIVARLLTREAIPLASRAGKLALTAAAVVALSTLKAPGLAVVLAILLMGYANGHRPLMGFGILASLLYVSHYYYWLDVSLLEKSALMISLGVALLLARLVLRRAWPPSEVPGGA